jgi:hypothetical protein
MARLFKGKKKYLLKKKNYLSGNNNRARPIWLQEKKKYLKKIRPDLFTDKKVL